MRSLSLLVVVLLTLLSLAWGQGTPELLAQNLQGYLGAEARLLAQAIPGTGVVVLAQTDRTDLERLQTAADLGALLRETARSVGGVPPLERWIVALAGPGWNLTLTLNGSTDSILTTVDNQVNPPLPLARVSGGAAEAPVPLSSTDGETDVELDAGPQGAYTVLEDPQGRVLETLDLSPGEYFATYSKPGYRTTRVSFRVERGKKTRLQAPALAQDANYTARAGLELNLAGVTYLVLLWDARNQPVRDLSRLEEGLYYVTFYDGAVRLTQSLLLEAGKTTVVRVPDWVYRPRSLTAEPTPATSPAASPAPAVPSSGKCWVNGYYRKNGTYVSGYWRSC